MMSTLRLPDIPQQHYRQYYTNVTVKIAKGFRLSVGTHRVPRAELAADAVGRHSHAEPFSYFGLRAGDIQRSEAG